MSFSRVTPGGLGVGAKFTSAYWNAIDVDHANAVDKTVAGDTISGTIQFGGSGGLLLNGANQITAHANQAVFANAAGGLYTGVAGGLTLGGGSTDWPTFSLNRSRTILQPLWGLSIATALTTQGTMPAQFGTDAATQANAPTIVGAYGIAFTNVVNSGSASVWAYFVPITQALHNGATLSTATLWLVGASSHGSLPAVMPAFGVFRGTVASGGGLFGNSINAGSSFSIDPTGSVGTYKTAHSWSQTGNQNNVIDTSQYNYFAVIWDEGSTNSQTGNQYLSLVLSYSSIPNMSFP